MNKTKIGLFFGGKISRHLRLLKKAANKMAVELDLISYNRVTFDSDERMIKIRPDLKKGDKGEWVDVASYDVLFFRTTGKHWEEVDLIVNQIKCQRTNDKCQKETIIVDPIVETGKPSMACKAYQMLALKNAGIEVPKSIYGSLWYLYEYMSQQSPTKPFPNPSLDPPRRVGRAGNDRLNFPVIVKGSGGDRGTRVFKADNLEELEKLVRELRQSEIEEGKRYMVQEYIENDGDYRILVLGDKVLGIMKRSRQNKDEFRNNFSMGGKVEVVDLPDELKELAVRATKACGLMVAGVDMVLREGDIHKPVLWEVNKGPQFWGFMEATGIDVPKEIVKFLVSLKKQNPSVLRTSSLEKGRLNS